MTYDLLFVLILLKKYEYIFCNIEIIIIFKKNYLNENIIKISKYLNL